MKFIMRLFTWWNTSTIGTQIFTRRHGQKVGEDEQGNVFYQTKDGTRRWVIYNGDVEASRVSPDWHGWLHHTYNDCPVAGRPLNHKSWEKPHQENMTGTQQAYRPPGSVLTPAKRDPIHGDYQAWQPE